MTNYEVSLLENIQRHAKHGRSNCLDCSYNNSDFADYFQAILDDVDRLLMETTNESKES